MKNRTFPDNIWRFPRPAVVLRYLRQEIILHKAEYKALETRQPDWDTTTVLTNGLVHDGQLLLHADLPARMDTLPTEVLLLNGRRHAEWIELSQRSHVTDHFLRLHEKEGQIWVECVDNYYPLHGSKPRDRFDIMPLSPGKSVAVQINARYWHTLTGRGMDTHYVENYLYFEHLGTFSEARLVGEIQDDFQYKPQKVVNLRHMMF